MNLSEREDVLRLVRSSAEKLGPLELGPFREPKTGDDLVSALLAMNYERIEARDALACHLLSYSALLLERGRIADAEAALMESSSLLSEMEALYNGSQKLRVGLGRILTLEAACAYNFAVLLGLAGAEQNLLSAWTNVWDYLDLVDEQGRAGELYRSFERVIMSEFPKFTLWDPSSLR